MLYKDTPEYEDVLRAEKSAMRHDVPPAVMCRDMAVAFRRSFDYDETMQFSPATSDPSVLHAVLWDGERSRLADRLVSLDVVMPAGYDPGAVMSSTLQVEPLTAFKGQWPIQIISHNPPNAPTHEVPVFGLGGVPVDALKQERMTVLLHCASPEAASKLLLPENGGGGVTVIARFRLLPPSPTMQIPYFPDMPERKRAFYTGFCRADVCHRTFHDIYKYVLGIVFASPSHYDTYLLQDHTDLGIPIASWH